MKLHCILFKKKVIRLTYTYERCLIKKLKFQMSEPHLSQLFGSYELNISWLIQVWYN